MAQDFHFLPGAALHDAIVGAFKAHGGGFENWCAQNGIHPGTARNATFGQSRGKRGSALLLRIISAAGPDVVRSAYSTRVTAHASELVKGAA